jgi:hypothetical protein
MTDERDDCPFCQLIDRLSDAVHREDGDIDFETACVALGSIFGAILATMHDLNGEAGGHALLNIFHGSLDRTLEACAMARGDLPQLGTGAPPASNTFH